MSKKINQNYGLRSTDRVEIVHESTDQRLDPMDSNDLQTDVSNDESFYGVFVEADHEESGQ